MNWTEEEDELLLALRSKGMKYTGIAERIPGRSAGALRARHHVITLKPYQVVQKKDNRNKRLRERYKQKDLPDFVAFVIPPNVLAERDARLKAPLTISGMLLGDPPLGFSALDRRAS